MRTYVRMRGLKDAFAAGSSQQMDSEIVRLAVLYEDLRIELHGISARGLGKLDKLSREYRRQYFLRRSIATLLEFSEAIRHLDGLADFEDLKTKFERRWPRRWGRIVRFFKSKDHLLREIRNDTGGHFGLNAATYATRNYHRDAVGKIEYNFNIDRRALMRLHFTAETVATVLLRHVRGSDPSAKSRTLIRMATASYRHATTAMGFLATFYLWDKFGK